MNDPRPKLVIFAGPTASGKTKIAVEMALDFCGEIVNADSMQVYRYMDIGTAKPAMDERKGVLHHLVDVVDPDEEFNASIYRKLAIPAINSIIEKNRTCFTVGGTGLYIRTLLGGLMECPPSDPGLRESLVSECMEKGSPFLYERLKRLDPESAGRIHPNDKTRVIRALEIVNLAGMSSSSLIKKHAFGERIFRTLKICLNVDRDMLYDRINARCERMIQSGLIDEAESLLSKGYSPDLRSMKSLGYRHAVAYLKKEWNGDEMMYNLKLDTRRYAKRQMTWFRADPEVIWVEPGNKKFIKSRIEEFINKT
jgi:tRNA dimethylallyltransferase